MKSRYIQRFAICLLLILPAVFSALIAADKGYHLVKKYSFGVKSRAPQKRGYTARKKLIGGGFDLA